MRMTKETTVMMATEVSEGRNQNRPNWKMYMMAKVQRRVMASETEAQKMRPTELPMLTMPTIPAATTALAPVSFWKSGASWEMIEMPAVVFKKSSTHNAHHCQLERAEPSL